MKGQKGTSLIEVIIAIALLGIIGIGFISALGTGSKALLTTDVRETAKNLAESQMEFIKRQSYNDYEYEPAPIPGEYSGYTAIIGIESIFSEATDVQKITVTISHQGREVIELDDYKVR